MKLISSATLMGLNMMECVGMNCHELSPAHNSSSITVQNSSSIVLSDTSGYRGAKRYSAKIRKDLCAVSLPIQVYVYRILMI